MESTMNKPQSVSELNRRDFLKGSSAATLMALMGGVPIYAGDKSTEDDATEYTGQINPVNCAVIGCGAHGREVLATLARLAAAPVVAICDTYEPYLRRSAPSAPKAEKHTDYRKLLEQKEVQAVIVATPSHQHRQVVLDAFAAGKHVYCEMPLAHTPEDSRAIAQAAKGAFKLNFQAGLQNRADPQRYYLVKFVRTGIMGQAIALRSQWHRKKSWRLTSPNPAREQEINWRLQRTTSPGLLGEIGVHQVDVANWMLARRPLAVTGLGSVMHWKDGRDVPDAVEAIFEYPGGELFTCQLSLTHSFDAEHELYYGTNSTIMCRDRRAWMFKEVDSPQYGWDVYARKEAFYQENGIVLDANTTKLGVQTRKPTDKPSADEETALYHAFKAFVTNCHIRQSAVEDFGANFDANDIAALKEYLGSLKKNRLPAAGYQEGCEATVTALKANEAILKKQRIVFEKEWFDIV
jgi:predicted dehydrogenase